MSTFAIPDWWTKPRPFTVTLTMADGCHETIEAERVGLHFAVHRHIDIRDYWTLTHIPTGLCICCSGSKANARGIGKLLLRFDIPWASASTQEIVAAMKLECDSLWPIDLLNGRE